MEIKVFIKRIEGLKAYLISKSGELLMKHEREIVELNNAQLMEGKNADNKLMQKGYSPGYGKRRKKAGLQTSFVDLRFTGKYQDTRKGEKVKDGMNIVSGVDYEKYLRGNFPKHSGLTDPNAEKVGELLMKDIAVLINKYLEK